MEEDQVSHLCGVVTCSRCDLGWVTDEYGECPICAPCDNGSDVGDEDKLCGLPAPHENPDYLAEDGIYKYTHWLCDGHWDDCLDMREEG
jgi:hypothetical protein